VGGEDRGEEESSKAVTATCIVNCSVIQTRRALYGLWRGSCAAAPTSLALAPWPACAFTLPSPSLTPIPNPCTQTQQAVRLPGGLTLGAQAREREEG
jgi:hypothetical protein